jgi:hypothetical protein
VLLHRALRDLAARIAQAREIAPPEV